MLRAREWNTNSRSLIAGGYELDGTEEALAGSAAERISQRER